MLFDKIVPWGLKNWAGASIFKKWTTTGVAEWGADVTQVERIRAPKHPRADEGFNFTEGADEWQVEM